ncbi:hypothetical protein C7974DRAFT_387502 [Boeremia exigua]|uniref:uncharacterized protein n=1 Tax=Boeremia exigua TaxID=749465 RepID=UPI001E8CDFBE|nr:uncharacterized protein C7974DRAFT_387502 [Boeremia exigua]KAH6638903.1 hypothetical protein C7974DRAFT_387502 [Boeremia exigua]
MQSQAIKSQAIKPFVASDRMLSTSANMITFFLFAVSSLLVHAQQNEQIPLQEYQPDLIVTLNPSDGRTYTFESALDGTRQLSLKAIAEIESYREINSRPQSALINIPLDPRQSGAIVLGSAATNNVRVQQYTEWTDTLVPGEDVPATYIGVRRGGMVSMDAYVTRLALDTPYISIPGEMYDVLIQATNPTPQQYVTDYDSVVDCSQVARYPDLVLGLQSIDEADEDGEMVITPEQYILRTEEGQCVLLVQRGRAEIVLGWAAVRGKDVVLDWVNERTGFGRQNLNHSAL